MTVFLIRQSREICSLKRLRREKSQTMEVSVRVGSVAAGLCKSKENVQDSKASLAYHTYYTQSLIRLTRFRWPMMMLGSARDVSKHCPAPAPSHPSWHSQTFSGLFLECE